jgi:DNA-binding NarL/FixJ family response regulator
MVLVEGGAAAFERAVAELRTAGWRVTPGFGAPTPGPGRDARSGPVATADDAARALLAVLSGIGVVMHGVADRDVLDRLLGDLRHVGPVEHRLAETEPEPALDDDARAILRHLADGETLGEAADALGLSRRTADRRLAEARRALGVERTVEAVSRARRLGWLD